MPKYNDLTPEEAHIILDKGTEAPFSGKYDTHFEQGVYVCRRCNAPLYESSAKFQSHCGWPSFDEEIAGALIRQSDADGMRVEIICANCGGHLGHVFEGEQITAKNTRHCVNSLSLQFISADEVSKHYQKAVFASGCFWGTEYWFAQAPGVIATAVGYAGGLVPNPSYREVCRGNTGHAEAIQVIYDPKETDYEALVKLFYETHDPSQVDRQGPDVGTQYRSVIFVIDEAQQTVAEQVTQLLIDQGVEVATKIEHLKVFYPERDPNHQKYYFKKGSQPYCHIYQKKF